MNKVKLEMKYIFDIVDDEAIYIDIVDDEAEWVRQTELMHITFSVKIDSMESKRV
jgi:hypothetical protein